MSKFDSFAKKAVAAAKGAQTRQAAPVIDFGPTAGLVYRNGKFYDEAGNRVDPNSRPAPAAQPISLAPTPPEPPKPTFALPSFDAAQFGQPAPSAPAPAQPALPPIAALQPAPMPVPSPPPVDFLPQFAPPQVQQPILPSFAPPADVSAGHVAPASVAPVGPAPAPVPFVPAPSGGLIQAQDYSPAPEMPGYAQARTGSPFRAPQQAANIGNLFAQISQPYGSPIPAEDDDNSLLRAVYGRNLY